MWGWIIGSGCCHRVSDGLDNFLARWGHLSVVVVVDDFDLERPRLDSAGRRSCDPALSRSSNYPPAPSNYRSGLQKDFIPWFYSIQIFTFYPAGYSCGLRLAGGCAPSCTATKRRGGCLPTEPRCVTCAAAGGASAGFKLDRSSASLIPGLHSSAEEATENHAFRGHRPFFPRQLEPITPFGLLFVLLCTNSNNSLFLSLFRPFILASGVVWYTPCVRTCLMKPREVFWLPVNSSTGCYCCCCCCFDHDSRTYIAAALRPRVCMCVLVVHRDLG